MDLPTERTRRIVISLKIINVYKQYLIYAMIYISRVSAAHWPTYGVRVYTRLRYNCESVT